MVERPDAYFAGLLDGEGSFFARVSRDGNGVERVRPNVLCQMAHEETIRVLQCRFGGSVSVARPKDAEKHRVCYSWKVQDRRALDVARLLLPFFVTKREAAALLLEFPVGASSLHLTDAVKDARLEWAARMRHANRRGPR